MKIFTIWRYSIPADKLKFYPILSLSRVHTQVKAVLAELKSSRKIATATHNILAYRYSLIPQLIEQAPTDTHFMHEAALGWCLLENLIDYP